jgi:site-specific DNA recombinase
MKASAELKVSRAALYARVSSKEQEREGYSIPSQLKLLREYALHRDLEISREFVDVETAKQAGRGNFGEMLKFLSRNRTCRTLLVEKTDRLYRNLKDWVSIDELELEIHFVKENVVLTHSSRSAEKFMHGIKVLMAKNYIDNLAEEASKGLREKAEQGMWPSYSPLGYHNVGLPDGRRGIEPDPERAPLIAQLFTWYATGNYSLKEVARKARQAGLQFRNSGVDVPTPTVHKILRNRTYTGDFSWKGRMYRGKYQPIVSKDLYEQVQEVLDNRGARSPKQRRHRFAFTGLVRCGHCGCSMTGELHKGRYVYYRCTGYKGRCPEKYAREESIANQFAELLKGLHLDADVQEFLTNALRQSHHDEKRFHEEALTRLTTEHAQLQNRLDQMYVDKLDGKVSESFYDRKAGEWRAEQDRIAEAIEEHRLADRSYADAGVQLLELAGGAYDAFVSQGSEERRKLLQLVVSNSTWKHGRLALDLHSPFDLILKEASRAREADARDLANGIKRPAFENWRRGRDLNSRWASDP